tara:strand:+ start:1206 stop:2249 length:1044 start_codon:yes stop_codon:yes gene_type:complete
MITLNGQHGEGGGALVRTALALSTVTGKEFTVINIRSGRTQPGLKAQHLHAINALKEICGAETNEIKLGSTQLQYKPGKIKSGTYDINIGTAGSITLLLQALILPCLHAPSKVTLNITGGTCGKWQASVDYLQQVLLPHLRKFAKSIDLKILKRGYYPKGGGEIMLEISPKKMETLPVITLIKQGKLEQIKGRINLSRELQEPDIGERVVRAASSHLKKWNVPVNIDVEYSNALSVGGEILLWTVFSKDGEVDQENPTILGASVLLEKGKSSETVGKEVAQQLNENIASEFPVDEHLADQLIQFMEPGSKVHAKISEHTKTNTHIAEQFLPIEFEIEQNKITVRKVL